MCLKYTNQLTRLKGVEDINQVGIAPEVLLDEDHNSCCQLLICAACSSPKIEELIINFDKQRTVIEHHLLPCLQ